MKDRWFELASPFGEFVQMDPRPRPQIDPANHAVLCQVAQPLANDVGASTGQPVDQKVDYAPVATDGATRAAALLADLV